MCCFQGNWAAPVFRGPETQSRRRIAKPCQRADFLFNRVIYHWPTLRFWHADVCHLSNGLYQTHREGRWIGGREKERVKEGKTRQRLHWEKQRDVVWGVKSAEFHTKNSCLCMSLGEFFQGRVRFPETLKEKRLGGEIFSRWQRGLSYTELCFDEWQNVLPWHISGCRMKGRNMLCEYTSPTSVLVLFTHNICTTRTLGGIVEVCVSVRRCGHMAPVFNAAWVCVLLPDEQGWQVSLMQQPGL